mmetsp:Transcript_52687/g.73064  ORF Transcript_52687/g.73064 Transcript_52687/m.73064 type:complete len:111 (-) Transcript_52687:27-359(-)
MEFEDDKPVRMFGASEYLFMTCFRKGTDLSKPVEIEDRDASLACFERVRAAFNIAIPKITKKFTLSVSYGKHDDNVPHEIEMPMALSGAKTPQFTFEDIARKWKERQAEE